MHSNSAVKKKSLDTPSATPRVDSIESFMYVFGKPLIGYVRADQARQIEIELAFALNVIHGNAPLEDLLKLQDLHRKGKAIQRKQSPVATLKPVQTTASAPQPQTPIRGQKAPPKANIESAGSTLLFETGQLLFNKGDEADSLMIILDGKVEIFDPNTNKGIAILSKGVSFGEQALLQGGMRTASARAKTSVTCLQIPTEPLRRILKTDPGILTLIVESLLLQLNMANQISRLADPAKAIQTYEIMPENNMNSTQLQKLLHEISISGDSKDLSSQDMMFYRLQASDKLITTMHEAGTVFASPLQEHLGNGLIVINGHIEARIGDRKTYHLGPGSVLGLAEGLKDDPFHWTLTAMDNVTILNIPVDKSIRGLTHANAGIRGIVRYTSERILELQKSF